MISPDNALTGIAVFLIIILCIILLVGKREKKKDNFINTWVPGNAPYHLSFLQDLTAPIFEHPSDKIPTLIEVKV